MDFINYNSLTTQTLNALFDQYSKDLIAYNNSIANLSYDNLSYQTVMQSNIDFDDKYLMSLTVFKMDSFHPDENIRNLCNEINTKLSKLSIEQSLRKDVYDVFKRYYDGPFQSEDLSPIQIRYVKKTLEHYLMNGMGLTDENYKKFKALKTDISENSIKFKHFLAEDKTSLKFIKSEVTDMPDNWINNKTKDENGFIDITLKYPDYIPIMEYCSNRNVRQQMATTYLSRGLKNNYENSENNLELLKKNLINRSQLAKLFGKTYVDYKLQDKMAKTKDNVMKFLDTIENTLKPYCEHDLLSLTNFARSLTGDENFNIEQYDIAYYSRLYKEQKLHINMEEIKKFFSTQKVIEGTMEIYQLLLGLSFENISDQFRNTFWHESIQLFSVKDKDSTDILGYFYLDLFPRTGKYGHAAVFPFVRKTKKHIPIATMACNFDKNGNLTFDEVETFFHEFGHVMHNICTTSTINMFSGTAVERDFVETPSQFFENWCYDYNSLRFLAPDIPKDVVEKLNKMKTMLNSLHYGRQLTYAKIDILLHSDYDGSDDCGKMYSKLYKNIIGINTIENTNPLASFGHIMGGYDSGYYGYMWSEVYSKLLHLQFQNNMLNPELGMKLREHILAPGGTQDSTISMEKFLNRKLDFNEDIKLFIGSLFDIELNVINIDTYATQVVEI
jgi:thimet oligopeptidase